MLGTVRGHTSGLREKMLATGGECEGTGWREGKGTQQVLSSGLGMSRWMDEWMSRCIDTWMDGWVCG